MMHIGRSHWDIFLSCMHKKANGANFQGVWTLIINLIGTVFIEYTWDACYLCAVESIETSCRSSATGSCSLVARIGALIAPVVTLLIIISTIPNSS